MNITLKTASLREALAAVIRVIQRSPVDVMEAVLLYCEDQDVKVAGTSPHADIQVELGESHNAPFRFAVNAEKLKQWVDRATGETFKITLPDNQDAAAHMTFSAGNVRGKLKLLSASDFPAFSEPTGAPLFDIELDLGKTIPEVLWAAGSGGHLRPFCQGLNIIARAPRSFELMATTGVIVCRVTEEDAQDVEISKDSFITISSHSCKIISQVFGRAGLTAYVSRAVVEGAGVRMSVPLIQQGSGEPVRMPQVTGKQLVVDRDRLLGALKGCVAMSELKVKTASLAEVISEDGGASITLSSLGTHGEATEDVPVQEAEPTGLKTVLNAQQAISALGACRHENISLTVPPGPLQPHRLTCGNWETIVMPMKS